MKNGSKPDRPAQPDSDPKRDSDTSVQLRLARATLETVMSLSENAIIAVDRTGQITMANSKTEEILGIPAEEIIGGMTWQDFVPEEDLERLTGYFNARLNGTGNPPSTYTLRIAVPDEEPRFMRAHVGFVPGTDDRMIILNDLSDVVEEQRKTAESEERYRTVIENTKDGILICTPDRILFVNTSFCSMTGMHREEIYTQPPMVFFHRSERNRFESLFDQTYEEDGNLTVFETGIRKKSGFLPAELSATPVIYRGNRAVLLSIRDMTRRMEAEKKLKENHKLLQAIVENSPVGVSVHDKHGTLLLTNPSWRSIWGRTEEDLEERRIPRKELKMDNGDSYLGHYTDDVRRLYNEGGELHIPMLRIPNPRPGGAEYISHHFYALNDEVGNVDKVVILTLDLTESLKTEHELEETKTQYRNLFVNVPVAIYRTTLETGGQIVSSNPEMKRLFLRDERGDFGDITVRDLYTDHDQRRELMRKLNRENEVRGFETTLKRPDGSIFLASITAKKVSDKLSGRSYIEGMIRDITDERRMEEELQKIEHLDSIGTLAGGIAHDFNNLLMAIQGNISLAVESDDPSERERHLANTESSLDDAAALTHQLLTFARGGLPVKESMDVESCVRDAVSIATRGSVAETEFQFEEDLKRVDADSDQIAQVLHNIVLNSVQAMETSGKITVTCRNLELDEDSGMRVQPGDYVLISIRDSGCGIPEEDLRRIFNPYFTTKKDGTGLGLSTAYSIVKKHSGHLKVESTPGEGTEIFIYLPASRETDSPEVIEAEKAEDRFQQPASILIMDDDARVREVLKDMLEILGHT
ncbi:MAG: PAS domain S-box protein, partial [Candidatus Aegiribacteria sp.]|nr:PAS domain S-box protein [Candidatus Aegiribacteria sp.]